MLGVAVCSWGRGTPLPWDPERVLIPLCLTWAGLLARASQHHGTRGVRQHGACARVRPGRRLVPARRHDGQAPRGVPVRGGCLCARGSPGSLQATAHVTITHASGCTCTQSMWSLVQCNDFGMSIMGDLSEPSPVAAAGPSVAPGSPWCVESLLLRSCRVLNQVCPRGVQSWPPSDVRLHHPTLSCNSPSRACTSQAGARPARSCVWAVRPTVHQPRVLLPVGGRQRGARPWAPRCQVPAPVCVGVCCLLPCYPTRPLPCRAYALVPPSPPPPRGPTCA
jgi:hypothetical protein